MDIQDEQEVMNVFDIALESFYDPTRYSWQEKYAVIKLVHKIPKPIPDAVGNMNTYELIIYSTLLFFVSEGFDVFSVNDLITFCPLKEVPYGWRNAIRWTGNNQFVVFKLMIRDRYYSLKILHLVKPQEVKIFLLPYYDLLHWTAHANSTYPCVIFKTDIARSFVRRNRWLHFGFYLRYNVKKVFFEHYPLRQSLSNPSLQFRCNVLRYLNTFSPDVLRSRSTIPKYIFSTPQDRKITYKKYIALKYIALERVDVRR